MELNQTMCGTNSAASFIRRVSSSTTHEHHYYYIHVCMYVYVHTIKKGKVLFRKLWTANCLRTEIWLADNRTVQKPQKKAMMLHMLVFQFIALVFWKKKIISAFFTTTCKWNHKVGLKLDKYLTMIVNVLRTSINLIVRCILNNKRVASHIGNGMFISRYIRSNKHRYCCLSRELLQRLNSFNGRNLSNYWHDHRQTVCTCTKMSDASKCYNAYC